MQSVIVTAKTQKAQWTQQQFTNWTTRLTFANGLTYGLTFTYVCVLGLIVDKCIATKAISQEVKREIPLFFFIQGHFLPLLLLVKFSSMPILLNTKPLSYDCKN